MSTILRSLQRLLSLFEEKNIDYMLIGGYALPFYGRIRATIDVDIAVAIESERELENLANWLGSTDFEPSIVSYDNPLMLVVDRKEKIEIELWLKPDGVVFDEETLGRRRKVKLNSGVVAWVVSPEDFIVNKLARPDRGASDEEDVKSVLVLQENRLDIEYLEFRAKNAGVLNILRTIQSR